MEREKRQLEEKEAYRGPGRPKKNRFFSPPAPQMSSEEMNSEE
jgi:hypothetical protein